MISRRAADLKEAYVFGALASLFPPPFYPREGLRPSIPDDFVATMIGVNEDLACTAIREMRLRYKKPPMAAAEYLDCLKTKAALKRRSRAIFDQWTEPNVPIAPSSSPHYFGKDSPPAHTAEAPPRTYARSAPGWIALSLRRWWPA